MGAALIVENCLATPNLGGGRVSIARRCQGWRMSAYKADIPSGLTNVSLRIDGG